jgi:hypothetical protein
MEEEELFYDTVEEEPLPQSERSFWSSNCPVQLCAEGAQLTHSCLSLLRVAAAGTETYESVYELHKYVLSALSAAAGVCTPSTRPPPSTVTIPLSVGTHC